MLLNIFFFYFLLNVKIKSKSILLSISCFPIINGNFNIINLFNNLLGFVFLFVVENNLNSDYIIRWQPNDHKYKKREKKTMYCSTIIYLQNNRHILFCKITAVFFFFVSLNFYCIFISNNNKNDEPQRGH